MAMEICKKLIVGLILLFSIPFAIGMEISCQEKVNFKINEKQYCIATIPSQFISEDFKCYSYISFEGEILQVNPQYDEKGETVISISEEQETRQYFPETNGIVNFYFTGKNLLPEYDYTLGVKCSSPARVLTEEIPIKIDYENMEGVFSRGLWLKNNTQYLISGSILFVLIGVGGFGLWKLTI